MQSVVTADPMDSIHDTLFTAAEHAAHFQVTHSGTELALTVNLSKAKEIHTSFGKARSSKTTTPTSANRHLPSVGGVTESL